VKESTSENVSVYQRYIYVTNVCLV